MAQLKIRIQVKRSGEGVPLDQLWKVAQETQKLMRLVSREAAIEGDGYWLARNFHESHLSFDIEYIGQADDAQVRTYNHTMTALDGARRGDLPSHEVPIDLLRQYAVVAEPFDPGESVRFGLFYNGTTGEPAKWCELSKNESASLLGRIEALIDYHGTVQGIVHSLYKEANPPYFDLRDLAAGRLIKCQYRPEQYRQVVSLLRRADAVVLVSGMLRASRPDRKIEYVNVEKMEATRPLSPQQFRRLIGSAPNFTGDLTTSEHMDRVRNRGDG